MQYNKNNYSMPKISIIIPVYNTEKYLRQCLDSILSQTYTDFETILVDDGSTDSSGQICDEYAQKNNIFVVIHKQNEGVTKARIDGYNRCSGDYVTFIDADDYVSKIYLERMLNTAIQNKSDVVSCRYYNVRDGNIEPCKKMITGKYEKDDIRKILYESNSYYIRNNKLPFAVFLCVKLFKRDILKGALDKGLNLWHGEDFACVLYLLMYRVNNITMIDDYLYYYIHHDNQVTSIYRNDMWKGYENCWQRLIEIDKEGIWKEQMPYRIKNSAMTCIYRYKRACLPRCAFIEKIKEISDSRIMTKYVFTKICSLSIPLKEKVKLCLLKYKMYNSFYYLVR